MKKFISPPLIIILFSLLIAWQCLQIIWLVVNESSIFSNPNTAQSNNLLSIANWHLFGISTQQRVIPSTLNVQLLGISCSETPANSYAIMINGQGIEKVYTTGDMIDGARIETIQCQQIILNNHGEMQNILLPILQ